MGSFRDNTATRIFKAIEWYEAKLQQTLLEIEGNFEKYRISEALMGTYKLVWDDFFLVSRND
jgi:valyl-tRNA synthetase